MGCPDLARQEEFRTRNAGFADDVADERGVVVDLRRIEVTVAELDCRLNGALEVLVDGNLPRAETDRGHFHAVGKLHGLLQRFNDCFLFCRHDVLYLNGAGGTGRPGESASVGYLTEWYPRNHGFYLI